MCCCYAVCRRFTKRQRTHHLQRSDSFYENITDRPVSGAYFNQGVILPMNNLSPIELARLQMNFDPHSQSTAPYVGNGGLSTPEVHGSHTSISRTAPSPRTSSFYPAMKETSLQHPIPGLLIANKNAPILGPTEDFNEGSQVEASLTQESLTNSVIDRQLPKKTEIIHDDIKLEKTEGSQEFMLHIKEVEKEESPNEEKLNEGKPTSKSQPTGGTITTLSKKEASMIDLSMITMIKNSHFEEEGVSSPVEKEEVVSPTKYKQRRHTSGEISSDIEAMRSYETDTQHRRRMKALDLVALTSITSPNTKTSVDDATEISDDSKGKKVKRKESLSRRQSRSMANLSYGGEADDEAEEKPSKLPSSAKRPSSAKMPLLRASSMLEELTSIGSPSKTFPIEPVRELSQEVSQDRSTDTPSDTSSKQKEPAKLKSILKNSSNRRFSHSSMNLYHEPFDGLGNVSAGYSPGSIPRHMYSPRNHNMEDVARMPPAMRRPASAYTDATNPIHRSPSYDMKSMGYQYPLANGHHQQQLPVPEMDGNEQFWGRPVNKYYDSDVSSPDYLSSKRHNRFGAY